MSRPPATRPCSAPSAGWRRARASRLYKALWSLQDGSQAQGFTSDLVAAIDKAVEDGVDVINYSVAGTSTNFADPVELAFFNAAASGVFVSASAGNNGPTAGTVAHPSPWITTVAAGTHNRTGEGSVTLGNGVTYKGPSLATPVGPAPVILSTNAGLAGANPTAVRLCFAASDNVVNGVPTPVLDPAKVAGKIVVCDRGTNARVNKSLAVREAGGIGMILVNTAPNSLNADFHSVPTVHLNEIDGAAVKTYVTTAGAGATATINKATHRLQRARADDGGVFVARPAHRRRRRSAEARPDGARPGHPRLRRASRATPAATSISIAARRCRRRTWPVWRRC